MLGGRVTTLKFKEVGESKLTSVSTPKSPITRLLLSKVFSLVNISVVTLFKIMVNKISSSIDILIKILPCDLEVSLSCKSNSQVPTKSLAV